MSFGPDSSELEAVLGEIERCLQDMDTDNALSPAERELRSQYYTHRRSKIRSFLVGRSEARGEVHKEVDTSSIAERLRADGGHHQPTINQVNVSDESWKAITPPDLIHAVTHIREDFETLSVAQRRYFEQRCFSDLHKLEAGQTEPAVFGTHFNGCVAALRKLVPHSFGRLLDISLAQNGIVGAAPIEWAKLHLRDLIEFDGRTVDLWIKSVRDQPEYHPYSFDRKTAWEVFSRTDWRAPKWLHMQPNGNAPYDPSSAWDRLDESSTKKALKALRETRWILSLESTLEQLVGTAYEVLAKRKNSSGSQSVQRPSEPGSPLSAPPPTDNTFIRQGNVWSISYAGGTCLVPRQRGLEYIARLLQSNGHPMTALELRAGANPDAGIERTPEREMQTSDGHLWQERSDPKAIEQYRQEAKKLKDAISEARESGDQNEADELLQQLEAIGDHIRAETGLGGRGGNSLMTRKPRAHRSPMPLHAQ